MSRVNNDHRHLAKLQDYYARVGVLPSYSGISRAVGFRAKTAAVKLAKRLSDAGYLRVASNGRLAPEAKFFERSVASSVCASTPETVDDPAIDAVSVDRYLIDKPSQTIFVGVKGESMRDAGIHDGDIVVVERRDAAERGDFVVAIVNGEFTLKELDYEGKRPVLRPHNDAFPVLTPGHGFQIFGVVRGVVRRYGRTRVRRAVRDSKEDE
jgi:repressor LexA